MHTQSVLWCKSTFFPQYFSPCVLALPSQQLTQLSQFQSLPFAVSSPCPLIGKDTVSLWEVLSKVHSFGSTPSQRFRDNAIVLWHLALQTKLSIHLPLSKHLCELTLTQPRSEGWPTGSTTSFTVSLFRHLLPSAFGLLPELWQNRKSLLIFLLWKP